MAPERRIVMLLLALPFVVLLAQERAYAPAAHAWRMAKAPVAVAEVLRMPRGDRWLRWEGPGERRPT